MGVARAACVVTWWCALGMAHADDWPHRTAFIGADVGTDLATHVFRVSTGMSIGRLAGTIVLDPWGYVQQTEHDTDGFVEYELWPDGWSVLGGWRLGSNPVLGTRVYHETALLGVSASVPKLLFGHVRTRFTGELNAILAQHGADLPTIWLWDRDHPIYDGTDFGIFVRVEYARTL
jgi:hypothetical protein